MPIKIVVTQAGFDEHFSIEDWFNFSDLTNKEMYEYILHFVVDSEGKPVDVEEARKMFKAVKKAEWAGIIAQFIQAVQDAFVNPTSGSD